MFQLKYGEVVTLDKSYVLFLFFRIDLSLNMQNIL